MTTANQTDIDYMNYCQKRLTADLRTLEKRATLTIATGATSVTLPDEVVRVLGIYSDGTRLRRMTVQDYMRFTTSGGDAGTAIYYLILGRTLYTYPAAAASQTLDVFYSYRSATIDSASTFEVTGESERLLERLVSAYKLIDDGQPELGQVELGQYLSDVGRMRRRFVRGKGASQRLPLFGHRRVAP